MLTRSLTAAFFLGAVLVGCSRSTPPEGTVDGSAGEAWPRYWLKDTPLLDINGKQIREVEGPVLVELLPTGRVRNLPGAAESFEGYLPDWALHFLPLDRKGLMLYVQRTAPIAIEEARKDVGLLAHRGAFLSVRPTRADRIAVGSIRFVDRPYEGARYMERNALGIDKHPVEPPKKDGKLRAVLTYPGKLAELPKSVRLLDCFDFWVRRDSPVVSQYLDGIELTMLSREETARHWKLQPGTYDTNEECRGHAIEKRQDKLFLIASRRLEEEVRAIPEGYERYEPPASEPLRSAIEHSAPVYWLYLTESGPACQKWTFKFLGKQVRKDGETWRAKLELAEPAVRARSGHHLPYWYPVTLNSYLSRKSPSWYLKLGELRKGSRKQYEKSQEYQLLRADQDELLMMARSLGPEIVAYDPADTERWFLSQTACERVRDQLAVELEKDGTRTTRMGFHAYEESMIDDLLGG